MVKQTTTGTIGDAEVELVIDSDDEDLANLIYADAVGHLDELRQIVNDGVPPSETEPPMNADWESFQESADE